MKRDIYDADHESFRDSVRSFLDREVKPSWEKYIEAKQFPREMWLAFGRQGLLGLEIPEQYGGSEAGDFRYNAVLCEELGKVSMSLSSCHGIHADIVAPYLVELTTEEQRERWLPGFVSGEILTAIGMTEASGGSDLAALKTTAVRDGDDWILNGSKTFITNGYSADLVVVAARTDPDAKRGRHLAVRHRGGHGGLHPRSQARQGRSGRVRHGRALLRERPGARQQPHRRAQPGLHPHDELAAAGAPIQRDRQRRPGRADPRRDPGLLKERKAFGQPIGSFQYNKFRSPSSHQDRGHPGLRRQSASSPHQGRLPPSTPPRSSGGAADVQNDVLDACVQLYGGYGYMNEYRVARAWRDARVSKIWAGSNEIMKDSSAATSGCNEPWPGRQRCPTALKRYIPSRIPDDLAPDGAQAGHTPHLFRTFGSEGLRDGPRRRGKSRSRQVNR